jgi:hypothetical protein
MVGRDANGKPLMPTGTGNNDFVYDTDPKFQVCPAAAHIRKANPRTPETIGARIVRRGVPYDFEGTKGLLFQSFGSTLEETFEAILNTWLLNEDFPPNASSPGMDPFLGTRNAAPAPAGFPMAAHPKIPSMSTVKAGEYFYFPSIPAFGRLDE